MGCLYAAAKSRPNSGKKRKKGKSSSAKLKAFRHTYVERPKNTHLCEPCRARGRGQNARRPLALMSWH